MTDTTSTEPAVEQMSYKDALDYAIFAINTLMHPDASDGRDIDMLEAQSDEIIATLADIRETVQGMAVPS